MKQIRLALFGLCAALQAAAPVPGTSRLLLYQDPSSREFTGVVQLSGPATCTGTFLKQVPGSLAASAPAYILTAGHCTGPLPSTNDVTIDRATAAITANFLPFSDTQDRRVRVASRRVVYSTMKGTDLGLIELEATFGDLTAKGFQPRELAAAEPAQDEPLVIAGVPVNNIPREEAFLRRAACTDLGAATLVELVWTFRGFRRNQCPDIYGGSSGSAVLAAASGKIVGVISTSTQGNGNFGGGFDCYLNVPCEIRPGGPQVLREMNYAASTRGLDACFRPDGHFELSLPGCPLDNGVQVRLSGAPNRTTRPYVESGGQSRRVSWNTTVSGEGFTYYRYKIGPETDTDCRAAAGYGRVRSLAEADRIDEPLAETPGGYYLCVQGGRSATVDSTWQPLAHATFRHVRVDTSPPILPPSYSIRDRGADYELSLNFVPPELSSYSYKFGPAGQTRCEDSAGYQVYRRVPVHIPKPREPSRLCIYAEDEAGNRGASISLPLDGLQVLPGGVLNGASFLPGPLAPGAWATLFGLGIELDAAGTRVSVLDSRGAGRRATAVVVDTRQVNFLVPEDTQTGPATVILENPAGRVASAAIEVAAASPGLFATSSAGTGPAAAYAFRLEGGARLYQPAFECAGPLACQPAPLALPPPGLFLEMYGTGLRAAPAVRASVNGLPVAVLSVSAAPEWKGVDQLDIHIPDSFPVRGYAALTVDAGGRTSNPVWLRLR